MASWTSWKSWLPLVVNVAASLVTILLFIRLLVDRTEQENIQAWQILQGYKAEPYNLGQTLALATLARNHQSLRRLQFVGGAWLEGVDLHGADMRFANLMTVHFDSARLDYANLADSNLSYADFRNCRCRSTNFSNSLIQKGNFAGADLDRANFDGANLTGSDFTKMKYRRRGWGSSLPANLDQFVNTCWNASNPDGLPRLPPGFQMPRREVVPGYNRCK
jgi:hypothetical protein